MIWRHKANIHLQVLLDMEDRVGNAVGLQCWHGCWYSADERAGEEELCLW